MKTTMHHKATFGALALIATCGMTAALAESRQEQAARAVKQYDAPSAACALLTKDEVAKLTGRPAYTDPAGTQLVNDGSACDTIGDSHGSAARSQLQLQLQ